jgi:hypothetical protein
MADTVALRFLEEAVVAQSSALAWRDGFLLICIVFVLAVIPTWLLGRAQRKRAY